MKNSEVRLTKRAENILNAITKIEKWCQLNLNSCSKKVFVFFTNNDYFSWSSLMYSSSDNKVRLAIGDHGTYGADYNKFKTGMTIEDYKYYLFNKEPVNVNYDKRINSDGNLLDDDILCELINKWPSIKENLIKYIKEENMLSKFEA